MGNPRWENLDVPTDEQMLAEVKRQLFSCYQAINTGQGDVTIARQRIDDLVKEQSRLEQRIAANDPTSTDNDGYSLAVFGRPR